MRIPSLGSSTHNSLKDTIISSSQSSSSSSSSSNSLLYRLMPSSLTSSLSSSTSSLSSSSLSLHYDPLGHNLITNTNINTNNNNNNNNNGDNNDGESIQVVFSAQSRDAIIYVTVVLVIYIIIFVVLVVTSYRKSSALRETLNRHLRSQYATGPFGTPTILETDTNGDQVHCDTVDELHESSIQL